MRCVFHALPYFVPIFLVRCIVGIPSSRQDDSQEEVVYTWNIGKTAEFVKIDDTEAQPHTQLAGKFVDQEKLASCCYKRSTSQWFFHSLVLLEQSSP